ncbi:hypothetical protein Trisim1_011417 [Trichoderma cf. simile WF8]
MPDLFVTVLFVPYPGKTERVKTLLETISRQVEETLDSILQFQLFEEICLNEEHFNETNKIIVHIECKDKEAIDQYHALSTFRNFWNAISEENLLVVPVDANICKHFGGFAARN